MSDLISRRCPSCNAPIEINATTCGGCGKTLSASDLAQSQRGGSRSCLFYTLLASGLLLFGLLVVVAIVYFVIDTGRQIVETATAPPPRSDFTSIDACRCESDVDDDSESETMQLSFRTQEINIRDDHRRIQSYRTIRYYLDISGQDPWLLPITESTSPNVSPTHHFTNLFFSCHGDIVAIASGDRVTGWNVRSREVSWNRPLGAVYKMDNYVPPPDEGGFSVQCTSSHGSESTITLTTDRGEISVDIISGRSIHLP